ncbi:hypothetical protein CDD81_769 [Ophiocordyceps australis]|uniref:Midasin n=1 Tax=Ophiocordyceps australis TaxID=1399860 RepID=A0A2C5XXB8_9HYPO|nr:hypothetical protein CDD81_769 [Ophiocordyceps australis]
MAQTSVSRQTRSLLLDATVLHHLPPDLLQVVRNYASPSLLDAVAQAALIPALTDRVFAHFEDVFADICARWILNSGAVARTSAAAFARILPFAPHLSQFLTCSPMHAHESTAAVSSPLRLQLFTLDQSSAALTEQELLESLITAWRLLSFDVRIFTPLVSPSFMQQLFSHSSPAVRCIAIRIYCLLLRAADAKLESLLHTYCGSEEIVGVLDGSPIDYMFLSLHEHARAQIVTTLRQELSRENHTPNDGPSQDSSSLVMTATTSRNLENFASMLQKPGPILLHGLAGAGKTALVHQVARQLGMYSNMVTLHLNEQTDAKMLIGLYSTNSKPGSFQWRPGVLTTAVKQGRWVLVEDIDRAPTEVLNSFRLFATIRTSLGTKGRETLPSFVGMRFWQSLYTEPPIQSELEQILLHIMSRTLNLRDLLKWSRRLTHCLKAAGMTTGEEPMSETTRDYMFMEALDCFIGSCPDIQLGKQLAYAIAEEMHMSRERADHYLAANIPPLDESNSTFSIGRVQLRKKKKRLLEQIAMAVKLEEPVLLVGETGIGKTTVQSEVGDLLGGFKPVNVRSLAVPLKEQFEDLFAATGISASKNQKYLEQIGKCFAKSQWSRLSKLWQEAPRIQDDTQPLKRRKTQSKLHSLRELRSRWDNFSHNLEQFNVQISGGSHGFAFSFVEGNLIKAVRNGDWVLLDEINLASPDTLESIADLLTGNEEQPSILLSETATDIDVKDLVAIIKTYLGSSSVKNDQAADDIARLYLNTKRMADEKRLVDGANETIAPLYGLLIPLIHHHLFDKHGDPQSLLSQPPKHPNDGRQYVKFQNQNKDRQYWLFQGGQTPIERDDYIITPYVERNLLNLVRATSTRRFPILIQGPTSAGKTSMIEYLANFTGNKFVRINNHEHTDLQEYLGTYISGSDGKLRFQEGLLVQAMRQEALNRLLDDNRELLIPETQEVNPPGLYGGRKVLSRAFRNRFLELHFDDIPEDELEFILQKRSRKTSPPDCRRIVAVYKELSRLRQTSRLFEQKDSFATLRDLFRWALREAETREDIAAHGFMLLAERVRNEEEYFAVMKIIEKIFKVKLDVQQMYSADFAPELKQLTREQDSQEIVWTYAMRRLYVLVYRALRNNEPVLLTELHIVNAHQNTETGDLIGSQRPTLEQPVPNTMERIATNETRTRALFEWSDGALVEAMKEGHFFLLDEISLADDSVLERLNSVLEPQRTLLLAEKGIDNSLVVASDGFQFFATMNPGGDFGKKELSPALRNRFTEIWYLVEAMIEFAAWFGATFRPMATIQFSVREILRWVQFMNVNEGENCSSAYIQGAFAVFIDSVDYDGKPRTEDAKISFDAQTTALNAMRVVRALQVHKPILLEGSPGVGKTTLTDLMDLFGTDVPVEGQDAGHFAWREAPFLKAMQRGEWVLLDEMNLASQSVLEGLNACLDHRAEVYIAELDQVFKCHPDFRLFAAQNPHHQGGGRKGLPASFPEMPQKVICKLIDFISELDKQLAVNKSWMKLLSASEPLKTDAHIDDFLDLVVLQRFRTEKDRQEVKAIFSRVVGQAVLDRNELLQQEKLPCIRPVPRLAELESLMICVQHNMPCILSGPSGSGKSVLLQYVAALAGKPLADPLRQVNEALRRLRDILQEQLLSTSPEETPAEALRLLQLLATHCDDGHGLDAIRVAIEDLYTAISPESPVAHELREPRYLLNQPLHLENPRFEWLDGIIVKAMELGQWLVLDNANMCNASVLDRLNSLLEPNGVLYINEHCDSEGQPRVVKPHSDFRIFLTTDPRYGELSRAMRNHSQQPALEILSLYDVSMLGRFSAVGIKALQLVLDTYSRATGKIPVSSRAEKNENDESISSRAAYTQPIHPLVNLTLMHRLVNSQELYCAGAKFDAYHGLYLLQGLVDEHRGQARSAKISSLNRLQRSLISERVAAVSKDSTVKLGTFLSTTMEAFLGYLGSDWTESGRCKAQSSLLRFQAYWDFGTRALQRRMEVLEASIDSTFVSTILRNLDTSFDGGFKLTTGLSMEVLWEALRPTPYSDKQGLDQAVELTQLASRFDSVRWRSSAARTPSANELVSDLTTAVKSLETHIGDQTAELQPYLSCQFELVRQFVSTEATALLASTKGPAGLLQFVDCLGVRNVSLRSLALLEDELPAMGRYVSTLCADIAEDPILKLNGLLERLLRQIFALHVQAGLSTAREKVEKRAYYSALAWIHFSMGLVKLYVPDRIFDPQLRPRVELDFHQDFKANLHNKLSSLKRFEKFFTGQGTSIRIQSLEDEIEVSELNSLHVELANVIKVVTGPSLATVVQSLEAESIESGQDVLRLVKANVERLIDRLCARFEAYQDMTRPAVNALRCLVVGMSLCDAVGPKGPSVATQELVDATPFVGGGRCDHLNGRSSAKSFEYLDLIALKASVEGLDSLSTEARESIFECFHSFYNDWCKRLEADRKAEEAKTSLYRFRGTFEDEEEIDEDEFNQLFPSYDEDSACRPTSKEDEIRTTSLKMAQTHKKIFYQKQDALSAMRDACIAVGQRVSDETAGYSSIELAELKATAVGASYNFYTDANLIEARQLVSLVHKIKTRFRELQLVDEIGHFQPLEDVVQFCDKLLEQVHSEPLAKLMPKVEQLHAHVYEWQFGGWASKTYGVATLYDDLTNTIIRWRRLELSTWARLFDMEMQKCREDAYSWWFIAYQVVIAVPLSMMDSPSKLQEYAVSLIQSLELYFSTSILGQFKTRVALLRQLLGHLQLLVKNYPQAQVISHAVGNFVDYYARYEALVDVAIQKGRAPIEAKMKDVLLMASWKDTNINALRESARKSHQKLFRLVRKLRGVLGQQMKDIMQQGLPDDEVTRVTQNGLQDTCIEVSELQLEPLHQALPGWLEKHRRLANATTTVSVLKKIMESTGMASDAASTLDDFTSNLNMSMAELRKETPTVLSDETKDQVKHLKTRKRKLFADTLRDLRQMGLSYNLAQDKLEAQESLAAILTLISQVELPGSTVLKQAEYYLHKTLDLAPKVRVAAREHSEDLTGAEAGRSIGFVEGMIYFLLTQRGQLSKACRALVLLQSAASDFEQLGNTGALVDLRRREHESNCIQLLPWLSQMLQFATKLLQAYIRLGHEDLEAVVEELQKWTGRNEELLRSSKKLCKLPEQLASARHTEFEAQVGEHLTLLRAELNRYMMEKPNIAMILRQVETWTQAESRSFYSQETAGSVLDCAEAISTLTDSILVAVERASKVAGSPRGEDEGGWLKRQNNDLSSVLQQLHMSDVEKSIRHCIDLVQQVNLGEPQASAAIMTMFGLASAILGNFTLLCSQSVNRAMELHRATSSMAFNLTKAFMQIASQGFCTPQEQSDEKSGDAGQLESGTGLGDGDGAEDISKDVQPDEDLSELAQEANKEQSGEIEDQKDAVDMADEELEGEMGSVDGAQDDEEEASQKEDEEDAEEMDEEAGNVDHLDPTAVDEKMWDGDDEKAEKDQQGNKQAGQKQDDEQMAADQDVKQGEAEEKQDDGKGDEEEEAEGEDADEGEEEEEEDAAAQEELNRQDQNVEEKEALELPEDMELDFDDQGSELSDDQEMEDLSDVEAESGKPEEQQDGGEEDEGMEPPEMQPAEEDKTEENQGETDEKAEDKIGGEDEVQEEVQAEEEDAEEQESEQQPREADKAKTDAENAAPSDVKSSGMDQSAESMALDEQFQADAAQQENGDMGDGAADQDTNAGNAGATAKRNKRVEEREHEAEEKQESGRSNPFRKLGDALEKWHRQQSDIENAQSKADNGKEDKGQEAELGRREFEHLQDDDDAADTQAMGKAEADEVAPIDEAMAIDEETREASTRLMDGEEGDEAQEHGDEMEVDEAQQQGKGQEAEHEGPGAQMRGEKDKSERSDKQEGGEREDEPNEEECVDKTASLPGSRCPSPEGSAALRSYEECVEQWSAYQTGSQALSQALACQLRLMLNPSQATKLSGAYRSGKRLNMKRIIPYIASSYKRDKIWMRRSTPTRRNHQVLLCVDDSKSMGETASGRLALESLVMVTRALAMVEAGEVGIVGFGSRVFTAQPLSAATTSSLGAAAGGRVLSRFGFGQQQTNVAQLMRRLLELFAAAKTRRSCSSPQHDLAEQWQLALVLSDGLTPSSAHDEIRRLVREAVQQRVMIVFIVLDAGPQSVTELREARFGGDEGGGGWRVEPYLDSFPFDNYLLVRDLQELPGALAGLLKTWFAEVVAR